MIETLANIVQHGDVLALPAALIVGVLASLNPCCLPLYPAAAGCCGALREESLRENLGIAAGFVVGTSLATTLLGVLTGLTGGMFQGLGAAATYAMAAIPILAGLYLLDVFSVPTLDWEMPDWSANSPLTATLAGAGFSLVVTPCATPVLAGLLAYVASEGQPLWGGMLMFLYGLGLGVPLLVIGSTSGWALSNLVDDRLQRRATAVTGVLLIGVGLYMVWLA